MSTDACDTRPAVAWLVVDASDRRSVYLDEGRADQQAAVLHGIKAPLTPVDAHAAEAVAWLVVDGRGRRSPVLRQARAEELAAELGGRLVGLAPLGSLPSPNPDKEPQP